jgi:tRNA (guanosine-2'-O-)-methyltransferase
VVVEDIHKERNAATLMRTCEAVGVGCVHVVVTHDSGWAPEVGISRGTERWLATEFYANPGECLARLAYAGFAVYCTAVDPRAVHFRDVDYTRRCAIVFGNEMMGVSSTALELADARIMVPMMGLGQSLNVSSAAAVVLYEAQRQREAKGMYPGCGAPSVRDGEGGAQA